MTSRERTEQNAREHGIDTFTINEPTILSWVALNNEFQMTVFFDENGEWLDSKRVWLK